MKLKVGIIGAGRIGECHLKAYQKLDDVEIVGVADISQSRIEYISKVYGLKVFEDFEDLLKLRPNVVSICTPDFFHVQPCIKAAEMGAHILCEKPLATTTEDAEKIIKACKKNKVYLSVGYKFRYEKIYQETMKILKDKVIGEPISLYIARPQEISSVMNKWPVEISVDISNLCHEIDLAYWLLNSEPKYVFADYKKPMIERKNPTRVTLYLQHENNTQSILYTSIEPEFPPVGGIYDAKFHIIGTKGYILGERPNRLVICNDRTPSVRRYPINVKQYYQQAFDKEVKSFVNSIKLGKEPEVKGEDGLRALKVIDAARKSFASGAKVKIS